MNLSFRSTFPFQYFHKRGSKTRVLLEWTISSASFHKGHTPRSGSNLLKSRDVLDKTVHKPSWNLFITFHPSTSGFPCRKSIKQHQSLCPFSPTSRSLMQGESIVFYPVFWDNFTSTKSQPFFAAKQNPETKHKTMKRVPSRESIFIACCLIAQLCQSGGNIGGLKRMVEVC